MPGIKITKLSDLQNNASSAINFNATVIEIISEGDGEKKPAKINLKLEDSGEVFQVLSWKFDLLEDLNRLVETDEVYTFDCQATVNDYGRQIRILSMRNSGMRSTQKIIKTINIDQLKSEISMLIERYIVDPFYKAILQKLVIENQKFWLWPAATRIHHAYKYGLAVHSLNVCKNAIAIWDTYNGSNLNKELIVVGALIHDIGKIREYNQNGTRTTYGNFIPHTVEGYRQLVLEATKLGINENDSRLIMLGHIILSHHGKLEFGAPTLPYIGEAVIVSKADELDAGCDSMLSSLDNLAYNSESEKLVALDGLKIFKWSKNKN